MDLVLVDGWLMARVRSLFALLKNFFCGGVIDFLGLVGLYLCKCKTTFITKAVFINIHHTLHSEMIFKG